ncbi:MAG: metal ABC transporter substrate-binding protein [Muricomes sp.]
MKLNKKMEGFIVKKSVYILLSVIAVSLFCAACGKQPETDNGKLKVMASFYPMYDFAKKVGGDKVDVINMVPAGTEPHDWEPAATDIAELEDADVFIYSGAGMEHWTKDVLASLDNKDLTVVEASKGIKLVEGEEHEDEEDDAEEGPHYDPHVWLSPLNAKVEMENIKDALVKADPENKDYYTENYDKYAKEFDQLDASYKEELADTKGKDIIVAHEAFGYLCSAYGLNQVGIEGLSPDSEPDPARMDEIIKFAKEHQVKTIFFEELVSPKVAETIADEIKAETKVLNPLEGLSDEQLKAGEDYFSVMESNLKELKEALNQ